MNAPTITLRSARKRYPHLAVPSPCVSVCELDERSGSCKGCHRTLQEIAAWSQLGDVEKLKIWAQVEARQLTD